MLSIHLIFIFAHVNVKNNQDYVHNTNKRIWHTQHGDIGRTSENNSKYALFQQLIDSNGIVDESVLDKLKLNVRSLIASMTENCKDLLDLCIDVIYHNNMKAFGLHQLILLYIKWENEQQTTEEETEEE